MLSEYNRFIGCGASFEEADIVLFSVPFDGTTSYRPGTRFAGKAVRSESYGIETYSPYQDKDLTGTKVFDAGEIEISVGSPETALAQIEALVDEISESSKLPLMIGGEHLVTLGAIRSLYKKHKDIYILHFDAHADLRDDYLGVKNSHACVMRRCHELTGDGRIYQFGIRSGDGEEFLFAKEHTKMQKFDLTGLDEAVSELSGKNVYLTIDLDILDPSEFPGTGTPEAGGITFSALLGGLIKLRDLNLVGIDMVELSPPYDQSGASTALACKLLREIILSRY